MNPIENDADPVSVWQGSDDGKMYFYAVNRLDEKVSVTLTFSGPAKPQRLVTQQSLDVNNSQATFELQSYQLLAFAGGSDQVKVTQVNTTVPQETIKTIQQQIDFSMKLLNDGGQGQKIISLSPVQFRQGFLALQQAQVDLNAGRVVSARRKLFLLAMTRVYEAFGVYPPGLYHRKSPAQPVKAMSATDLRNATIPASTPSQVVNAKGIDASLSGRDVFTWYDSDVVIEYSTLFSNQFEFELMLAKSDVYAVPGIQVDGKLIPVNDFYQEATGNWIRLLTKEPLSLSQGAHQFKLSKERGSEVGVFYMNVVSTPRDLIASDWRVLGPFPGAPDPRQVKVLHQMMNVVYQPEKKLDFNGTCVGLNNQTLHWKQPNFNTDFVDLYRVTGEMMFKVSYAACLIESPDQRDAQLSFGVDYWAEIWVNGKEVFNNVGAHNAAPYKGEYQIPIKLVEGKNELLVKVHAGSAGNGFWMSISDLGDLKVITSKAGSV
jgi:hypothetical protein